MTAQIPRAMGKLRFEGAADSQIPGVLGTSLPASVVENQPRRAA